MPALIKAVERNLDGLFLFAWRSFAKNAQDFGRRLPCAKNAHSRLLSASS